MQRPRPYRSDRRAPGTLVTTTLQERCPGRAVQGNLDPAILLAGPEATRSATRALLQRAEATGHVFNLGHGVLPDTPLASVEALIEEVHATPSQSAPAAPASSDAVIENHEA